MTLGRALEETDRRAALLRVDEVLARNPSPTVHFAAAHVLQVLGRHQRALDALHRASIDPRLAARSHAVELEWMLRLGRLHEARAFVAAHPSPRLHVALSEELANLGCHRLALASADAALGQVPTSASLLIHRAMLRTELGERAEGLADLSRATALRNDPPALIEASRLAASCGDFAAAEDYARRADAREMLGRIALFRGDTHADGSATVRGGAAVLRGEMAHALDLLAGEEDAEACAFRSEALLALGRPEEALAAADRALMVARGPHLAARILQHLSRMQLTAVEPSRAAFLELASAVRELAPDIDVDRVMSDGDTAKRAFAAVLRALRGNRSTAPTRVVGDRLQLVHVDPGPRFASRAVIQRIVAEEPSSVMADLDRVIDAYPESALPRTHRGEVWLWLDERKKARDDLESVIRTWPHTRWAYIGLTCLETIEHRLERALEVCAEGVARLRSEGPAVFVHRGEALRLLGRHDEADVDLRKACALNPTRLSAPINLALNHFARGEHEAGARIHRDLLEVASGLFDDAATACGSEEPATVLEAALGLMAGNRSSSALTYITAGHLRSVVLDPTGRRLREGARRDRERAMELVARV